MKTIEEEIKQMIEEYMLSGSHMERCAIISFKKGVEFSQKWISVEDELPRDRNLYITKNSDNDYRVMVGEKIKNWTYPYIQNGYITHWRPIERI